MTTFAPDSPLAVRGDLARLYTATRNGDDIEALGIHMAQGGGTVAWQNNPACDNSSTYVIEYSGAIVQKVPERSSSHSMKPGVAVRSTDDPPFTYLGETIRYGATAARRALGADWRDPNTQLISIEVEGWAGKAPTVGQRGYDSRANPLGGPNVKQRAALKALVADIRRRRGPLPCLGHRDWQDYKACPGKRIPWVDYGGHGVRVGIPALPDTSTEDDMNLRIPEKPMTVTVRAGAWLYDNAACKDSPGMVKLEPNRPLPYVARIDVDGVAADDQTVIVAYEGTTADANLTSAGMYVRAADVVSKDVVPPPKPPAPVPAKYPVTVGGKAVGSVVLP